MASCWVSVEPPWATPREVRLRISAAGDADRIDAEMLVEAAVLDRDEGVGQMGRQLLDRDGAPAGLAAVGEQRAVGGEDRDVRRALRHRELVDRRQLRGVVGDDAGDGDHAPDAGDDRAIDEAAEDRAALTRRLAAALFPRRPGAARFRHLSPGPVLARQAQVERRRVARIEHRFAPTAALRHRKVPTRLGTEPVRPAFHEGADGHAKCGGLRGG